MPVYLRIEGLEDLRQQLKDLPADLADKAQQRITTASAFALTRIGSRYPQRIVRRAVKGTRLRAGLSSKVTRDGVSVSALVKDTARHAYLYENGTAVRRTDRKGGRGAMPAAHAFIPVVAQERRKMYEDLKAIVAQAGLKVTGEP